MSLSMLDKAGKWLTDMREKHLAVRIHYVMKDGRAIPCKATVGKTSYLAPNDDGIIVRQETRDFLISQRELDHIPEFGDYIVWNDSVYEVLSPSGRCVWRWSDHYHSTKRIFTKYYKSAGGAFPDDGSDTPGGGGSEGGSDKPVCPCPCHPTVTVTVSMCDCCKERDRCPSRMTKM